MNVAKHEYRINECAPRPPPEQPIAPSRAFGRACQSAGSEPPFPPATRRLATTRTMPTSRTILKPTPIRATKMNFSNSYDDERLDFLFQILSTYCAYNGLLSGAVSSQLKIMSALAERSCASCENMISTRPTGIMTRARRRQ